ncbi:MAG: hypothetical protein NC184_06150 [Roseburia sp.]|nr:hypothetical protein [Roseburia sp.]
MYKVNGKTAYLGDENSYSHAAASRLADELVGYGSMRKVFDAVTGGECEYAVLPVENNVEGAVNEVYDELFDCRLFIARQIVLPVRHSLIAASGATLDGIKRVVSHPQAIGQCRKFLGGLPVTVEAVSSTSAALLRADRETAAIALKPRDGQTVIAKGIQDSALNATRFALLSEERSTAGGKVSVCFDLKNEPGALLNVLDVIYRRAVNLTRILSRPHRSGDGEYRFFVDFDFDRPQSELDALMADVAKSCSAFGFLGRYDCTVAEDI